MNEKNTQQQLDEIQAKLNIILEEIELQRRHRREMDDLKDDLMRVGKDLYSTAIEELEEVHDQLSTGDIWYLFKKLLRNVNNITRTFEQLESAKDFFSDFAPVSRELTIDLMNKLDEFDRKGYFAFLKELEKILDRIVTSFTADDVKNLGDNIVTILETVKNLTQPDMLQTINSAVSIYRKLDIEIVEDISTLKLIRELNNPETRKGLAFAIKFLKNLASQQSINVNQTGNQKIN